MTTALALLAMIIPTMNPEVRHKHHKHKHVDPRVSIVAPYNAKLNRMADCESGGRWWLNTGNGFYGGLQFTLGTWWSAGGRGYPNLNSELEQKYRAVRWHNMIGTWVTSAGWPVCGYR